MILSIFGPDGVGKSTVTSSLADLNWKAFSGTTVASWPDQSWHRQFISRGIDESRVDNDEHFLEKIKRLHQMARKLERSNPVVVIDSDPFHKTLMYDYYRVLPDTKAAQIRMRRRFAELQDVAAYDNGHSVVRIHVYFQVSEVGSDETHAQIIHDRLQARAGKLTYFDPKSLEHTIGLVRACRELKALLEADGHNIVTVTTDGSFNRDDFTRAVQGFQKPA